MKKKILLTILKIISYILAFIGSILLFAHLFNRGNMDLTQDLEEGHLPLVSISYGDYLLNSLPGYLTELDTATVRDCLTPIDSDRKLSLIIEKNQTSIREISFRITSLDGSRLLEDTAVSEFDSYLGTITLNLTLKDLMESGEDYIFELRLTDSSDNVIHYYTRLVQTDSLHVTESLDFVLYFHNATFDADEATNIRTYLESNSSGDNTTFGYVNIHSSFKQVTWNGFTVSKTTEPIITLREANSETATVRLDYLLTGEEDMLYRVSEYYRVRYTRSRMYLLDYERTMSRILDENDDLYMTQSMNLGIQYETPQLVECSGGKALSFCVGNRLFSLNITDNTLTSLYSTYTASSLLSGSERSLSVRSDLSRVKIISVDEMGNVYYLVYGYFDTADHLGQNGIALYYFDDSYNLSEELFFIPDTGSYEVLINEVDRLSYISSDQYLYLMLKNNILSISLDSRTVKVIAESLSDNMYEVSGDGNLVLIQEGEDEYSSLSLKLLHLDTGYDSTIVAPEGDYIMPLGFMGSDVIYGLAHTEDVVTLTSGLTLFPMYRVIVESEYGEKLKTYEREGIYVTGGEISDNQLVMTRVQRNEKGNYTEIETDEILCSQASESGLNTITFPVTASYEKIAQLNLNTAITPDSLRMRTSRFVIYEGNRTVSADILKSTPDRFYIYGIMGLTDIRTREANAVTLAKAANGVVTDREGRYVWRKGGLTSINQILAIQAESATDTRSALAICLDDMLSLESVVRSTQSLLDNGQTAYEILSDNLPSCRILILTGCEPATLQYYINQDIPVLAYTESGESFLLIGYNLTQFAILDPQEGRIYKKTMDDTAQWLEAENATYITYIR